MNVFEAVLSEEIFLLETLFIFSSNLVVTSHMWLLSTWNVASDWGTEYLNLILTWLFKFYFILINLNLILESHGVGGYYIGQCSLRITKKSLCTF